MLAADNVAMTSLWLMLAALVLDRLLGEPRRWHPLVGFGHCAVRVEAALYGSDPTAAWKKRLRGLAALLLVTLPPVAVVILQLVLAPSAWPLELLGLYLCLGRQSLKQHVLAIAHPLAQGDLPRARQQTARIVSRDTADLNGNDIARAAVESTLENGHDALFATLFWFAVAGLPGALLHRLVNTLDAMWGYRNQRYREFGWAAARADDLLGLIPARLTALSYCLCGRLSDGWRCWRQQAPRHDSPNAGPVMAAGAGALGVQIGGDTRYQGRPRRRPLLGCGQPATSAEIARAVALVDRSLWLWLVVLAIIAVGPSLQPGLILGATP